jgi:hypothetical protein
MIYYLQGLPELKRGEKETIERYNELMQKHSVVINIDDILQNVRDFIQQVQNHWDELSNRLKKDLMSRLVKGVSVDLSKKIATCEYHPVPMVDEEIKSGELLVAEEGFEPPTRGL